jgi:predicted delta-1-pyrroline-5-carboxylate dehydrogenase group 2
VIGPFANEPALDLRRADVRASLVEALAALDRTLPLSVPVLVGDDPGPVEGIESTDPGAPERVVAVSGRAGAEEVETAVGAATAAAGDWGGRSSDERAATLLRAAASIRARRAELAALQVRECAKPWPEADADVCEAIDYLEYYARQGAALAKGRELIQLPGERNEMRYAPRGVVAVVSPWNFPLAIPTGMVAAALAGGNAVVLKPAEQSPGSALALVDSLRAAGVPAGAISLLPGFGDAGAALVRHPGVHVIAFTGSGAVGLEIVSAAAGTPPGQTHVKRVVAEMGGKNCLIVDADADLDEAVPAIVRSAFDYAGQKCSAVSRVLAHDAVADALMERLAGAVDVLILGQAEEFGTDVPPLIERAAVERVMDHASRVRDSGRVLTAQRELPAAGWFCAPVVATDIPPDAPTLQEEVFGPLLTVERVPSVSAACDVLERLPFGLTCGVFSRDPATVAEVARRSPAGNLYVNRRTTGAAVGRQPFGGNRLSGVGSKAGGPDYLLQFVEPRVVTENTMRHGIVIE